MVAFSASTLVFNVIKALFDIRNVLAPEPMAGDGSDDQTFIILNGMLMVWYLFNSYLMLFAMYTRLSILFQNDFICVANCHKKLLIIGLFIFALVFAVIVLLVLMLALPTGAVPVFGPSLLVQQLCVVSVLMPIVLCTVILFAASTKRISPILSASDPDSSPSRPALSPKTLGPQQKKSFQKNHMNLMLNETRMDRGKSGRKKKLKHSTSTMDNGDVNANLSANHRSLKRREQELLRKFVDQQKKTVVVIVLTLALQILTATIMARHDSLMTNKWTVLITSSVLSLNSGITLRSITSTHRQQDKPKQRGVCAMSTLCQCLRNNIASRRKQKAAKMDDIRFVKQGDAANKEDDIVEMEGIQIHRTGCHQTNKNPKLLLDDEMMDKLPYFDTCIFNDAPASYQSHGDPISIEMPSYEDSPPAVPSRIIPAFRDNLVESTLSLSSEGTTFNYEY